MTIKLTKSFVASFACPPGKRETVARDAILKGFAIRAYPPRPSADGKLVGPGTKVFQLQIAENGKRRTLQLGPATPDNLETARASASRLISQAKAGDAPIATLRSKRQVDAAEALTLKPLGELAEQFLAYKQRRVKTATFRELARHLRVELVPLHGMPAGAVRREHILSQR
jgi:hypothetical protein